MRLFPTYEKLKLGALAKFCCFIGLLTLGSCDGLQPQAEVSARRPSNITSDIDFSNIKPSDIHVNLKPKCVLRPHADETKRNLECELKTTDGKDIFKRIDGAEILIEFDNAEKTYLTVQLSQESGVWKLKAEFTVLHITDIKSMILGVDQAGKVDFFEFKFEYEDQIVLLSVISGTGETPDENGAIEFLNDEPVLNFNKQALRTPKYKVLTLVPEGDVTAKIESITSAVVVTGQANAFKVFNNFSNPAVPKLDLNNPSAGYCGKNIDGSCKLKFEISAPDFTDDPAKPFTTDFLVNYHNGLGKSSIKIRTVGVGAMIPTKVFGQADFTGNVTTHLDSPSGIFVEGNSLYVVDLSGNLKIWNINTPTAAPTATEAGVTDQTDVVKVDSTFYFSDVAFIPGPTPCDTNIGSGSPYFYGSSNLAIHPTQSVLVASSSDCNAIVVKESDGTFIKKFGGNSSTPSAASNSTLLNPKGVAFSASNVIIADRGNHRVLISDFNQNDLAASKVIGQTSFTSDSLETVSASTLNNPSGVAVSGNNLFIADTVNNRVLRYKIGTLPPAGGMAIEVFGQNNFTSAAVPLQPGRHSVNEPTDLEVRGGVLYITDAANHRVLSIPLPFE